MTQVNPARRLASAVLARVLERGEWAAPALEAELAARRLDLRDQRLATHLVYGTLRRVLRLSGLITRFCRRPPSPGLRRALLLSAFEALGSSTPPHALLSQYAALLGSGTARLLRAWLAALPPSNEELEPAYDLPPWLAEEYRAAYPDCAEAVMADLELPPPLWLWVAPGGTDRLQREGAQILRAVGQVCAVRLPGRLPESPSYRAGLLQPVNPASAAAVRALGEVQGRRVLDLAGGRGVKAALLAAEGASVLSADLSAGRQRQAGENLRRLGLTAEFHLVDLTESQLGRLPSSERVLLDAPCSGSGTLRNHPEIKLRLRPGDLAERAALQARMLKVAAELVLPRGRLVYSVCSVAAAEGPEQVLDFLAEHPDFSLVDPPETGVPLGPAAAGHYTLALQGVDSFFLAVLERR